MEHLMDSAHSQRHLPQETSPWQKASDFLRGHPFQSILILALLLRLLYLLLNYPLWWDSHVYISIGKYIFSGGELGIWESFRPLLHPLLLGASWKLGLNPFLVGKLMDVLFSLLAIYLVYRIAYRAFDKTIALLSALLFSLTPIFIVMAGMILADPLALFLGLLGVSCLLLGKGVGQGNPTHPWRLLLGGLFLGLSFMTRFPFGAWFGGVFLAYFFSQERWNRKVQELAFLTAGFLLPVIPYLIVNYMLYHNPFLPFVTGTAIVETATWLYGNGVLYYFVSFFLVNPAYLFFWWHLYRFLQQRGWHDAHKSMIVLIPLLALFYFLTMPRKEVRYMAVALPFLAMAAVAGMRNVYHLVQQQEKPWLTKRGMLAIAFILLLIPLPTAVYIERAPTFTKELQAAILEHNITAPLLVSDPSFVSFLDRRIVTLDGMDYAAEIYRQQHGKYGLLFVNDCDLACAPDDVGCTIRRKALLETMARENQNIFEKSFYFRVGKRTCTYIMYLPKQ